MLHEVVTSRDQTLRRPFTNDQARGRNNGVALITGDEKSGKNNEMIEFEIAGNFANKDGFNFFFVQKFISPGHFIPIYKSEIKPCTGQNFEWAKFSVLTSNLCKEENDREIRIDFYKS